MAEPTAEHMGDQEFKSVPGVPDPEPEPEPEQEPQQEDDVLFGDAPEYPTKNPRYN